MRQDLASNILTWIKNASIFLLVLLVSAEIALRVTSYEENSRIYFYGIFPVALPPTEAIWKERFARLRQIEEAKAHYATYDSLLGWSYRANYISKDSLYRFNEQGMRAHPQSLPDCRKKQGPCLHILLSGNSYIMSAEVSGQESLAYFLEKEFWDRGIPCHVYNGAAGNYSIDQAYLQWKHQGRGFSPDFVVLGVNPRHFTGNASIFPYSNYPETNIYYTKPRAIVQGDSLRWLNLPTLPPEKILEEMILNHKRSELVQYEYQQKLPKLRGRPVYSYLLAGISRYTRNLEAPSSEKKKQVQQVSRALLQAFQKEVKQEGGELLALQTPVFEDVLTQYLGVDLLGRPKTPYACEEYLPVVYTEEVFTSFSSISQGFMDGMAHYSPRANELVAKRLAERLLTLQAARGR